MLCLFIAPSPSLSLYLLPAWLLWLLVGTRIFLAAGLRQLSKEYEFSMQRLAT